MADKDWRARISIDVTEEDFNDLLRLIPWGMKNKLFNLFTRELIRVGKEHGPTAFGLYIRNGITVTMNGGDNNERPCKFEGFTLRPK